MQPYYEIETDIPVDHQLHIQLPENIPVGRAKIAVIYELTQIKNDAGVALKAFLKKIEKQRSIGTLAYEFGLFAGYQYHFRTFKSTTQ